jgi:hypothetical protein
MKIKQTKAFKNIAQQVRITAITCYTNQGHVCRVTYNIAGHESHCMKTRLNKQEKEFVKKNGLEMRQRIYVDC